MLRHAGGQLGCFLLSFRSSAYCCFKRRDMRLFLTPPRFFFPRPKDLNLKPETINCLEEDKGAKLMDLGVREGFINLISKAREIKAKINE